MPFFSYLGEESGVGDILAHNPARFMPLAELTEEALRGPSSLTTAERELIAAYVSGLNQCQFCHGAHAAFAAELGVDPTIFEPLLADVESAPVDDKLKPLLRYVRKLTLTPSRMVEADAEQVFAAGYDEQALEDAIVICALFNFYNRLVDGHGVRANKSLFPKLARWIVEHGYVERTRRALAERERSGKAAPSPY